MVATSTMPSRITRENLIRSSNRCPSSSSDGRSLGVDPHALVDELGRDLVGLRDGDRRGRPGTQREGGRGEHAEHPEQVRHGVADGGLVGVELLDRGRQRRGVGEGTGVHARHERAAQPQRTAHEDRDRTRPDQDPDDHPDGAGAAAQRREEGRSARHTDGVGEQRQPQLAEDDRDGEPGIPRRHRQRREEHRGRAQGEAAELHRARCGPRGPAAGRAGAAGSRRGTTSRPRTLGHGRTSGPQVAPPAVTAVTHTHRGPGSATRAPGIDRSLQASHHDPQPNASRALEAQAGPVRPGRGRRQRRGRMDP